MSRNDMARRLRLILDQAANIALIAAAATFIWLSVKGTQNGRAERYDPSQVELIGRQISLPGLNSSKSDTTVVLMLSERCSFCAKSVPLYHRIALLRSEREFELVAAFNDSVDAGRRFLSEHKLEVNQLVAASVRDVGGAGTPMILVLDRSGKIKKAWLGYLSNADSNVVMDFVVKSAKTRPSQTS